MRKQLLLGAALAFVLLAPARAQFLDEAERGGQEAIDRAYDAIEDVQRQFAPLRERMGMPPENLEETERQRQRQKENLHSGFNHERLRYGYPAQEPTSKHDLDDPADRNLRELQLEREENLRNVPPDKKEEMERYWDNIQSEAARYWNQQRHGGRAGRPQY